MTATLERTTTEQPVSPPPAGDTSPRRHRGRRSRFIVLAVTVALVAGFAFGRTTAPEPGVSRLAAVAPETVRQAPTAALDGVAGVAATVGPAVVQLETGGGLGSGVIYSEDGLILTAAHVLGAETASLVRLADGRTFEGRVLGTHQPTDVAVVSIEGADLPVAQLGLGEQLEVGELAVALGSPFGFDQTVTSGIVSSINRTVNGIPMVQTDAAINPGNSGGPLVDDRGRVIGINDVIFSRGGGNDGIGFAISIDVAAVVADQLAAGQEVRLAQLGVASTPSTDGSGGAVVADVLEGSAAAAAGVEIGDRIVAIGDAVIRVPDDVFANVVGQPPGSSVTIDVVRDDETISLEAILDAV